MRYMYKVSDRASARIRLGPSVGGELGPSVGVGLGGQLGAHLQGTLMVDGHGYWYGYSACHKDTHNSGYNFGKN